MSELKLREVHVMTKVPGTANAWRLSATHPAMRFGSEAGHFYIQNGTLFDGGGKLLVGDTPKWVQDEIAKANPAALRECGYRIPEKPAEKPRKAA